MARTRKSKKGKKAKDTGKKKSTRPRIATPPPAPGSPTSQGRLPTELVVNILGNLDGTEDKGTLASCMRVSPTFNRVAAPMLYHSITVPSGNNHPLAIPARSRYVKRSTPTKITNLDRVQGITIQRHWQDCEAVLGRTYSPFPPPIRIKWVFRADSVVFVNSWHFLIPPRTDRSRATKEMRIVSMLDLDDPNSLVEDPLFRDDTKVVEYREIVLVLWSPGALRPVYPDHRQQWSRAQMGFSLGLYCLLKEPAHHKLTVVNTGPHGARDLRTDLLQFRSKARVEAINFITMHELIRDHDTEGVFTPAQRRQLLEAQNTVEDAEEVGADEQ